MNAARVSVVVVSLDRPQALRRCLTGLTQQYYPAFEVVVVADPAGLAVARDFAGIRGVAQPPAGIAAARNLGIEAAAGDIIAFIDDDAVPEPTWLDHLAGAMADSGADAAGGHVRGRNGISFQWRGRTVDSWARHQPLAAEGSDPHVPTPRAGEAIRTEGTNCAFRAETLRHMGGFDPAFRFFLDETDLNMRLAAIGARTVLVPLAQVHHGYLASARRDADRTPLSLADHGASLAAFLLRHAQAGDREQALEFHRAEQRARLERLVAARRLSRAGAEALLAGFEAGVAEGLGRVPCALRPLAEGAEFQALPARRGQAVTLAGRPWSAARLARQAEAEVEAGNRVSVFRFSATALDHRVEFRMPGYWLQTGGLFGRSDRSGRRFRPASFAGRLAEETARVASLRHNPASQT
jgi:GT2 family glycosyltransferase